MQINHLKHDIIKDQNFNKANLPIPFHICSDLVVKVVGGATL